MLSWYILLAPLGAPQMLSAIQGDGVGQLNISWQVCLYITLCMLDLMSFIGLKNPQFVGYYYRLSMA